MDLFSFENGLFVSGLVVTPFLPASNLDSFPKPTPIGRMMAIVSADGQVQLPAELRESAQLQPGDRLEAQLYKGTLVLRKRLPLTPSQCAVLLEGSRNLPVAGPADEAAVAEAMREARSRRG